MRDFNDSDSDREQETCETREIAAWARPAYEATWRDYLAAGAPYGGDYDGLMRWTLEQVRANRAAYDATQRTGRASFLLRLWRWLVDRAWP